MDMKKVIRILVIVGIITIVGNMVFTYVVGGRDWAAAITPWDSAVGMALLILVVIAGLLLRKLIPVKIPSIAYIALVGIIFSLPGVPGSEFFLRETGKVQFLALTTPVLAYAGVSIGKDIGSFAKLGPKIIVVAILVFIGTFLGSAIVAQIVLKLTGQI